MNTQDIDYYSKREREEREKAVRASDTSARRAHREMADGYLAKLGSNGRQVGAGTIRIVNAS